MTSKGLLSVFLVLALCGGAYAATDEAVPAVTPVQAESSPAVAETSPEPQASEDAAISGDEASAQNAAAVEPAAGDAGSDDFGAPFAAREPDALQ